MPTKRGEPLLEFLIGKLHKNRVGAGSGVRDGPYRSIWAIALRKGSSEIRMRPR